MRKLVIFGCVCLLIIVAGGFAARRGRPKAAWRWTTKKIETGEMLVKATAAGTVEPLTSVQVGSQVSGKVKDVLVQHDDSVKAGQVLAVLDTELLENERRDKEIFLKQAQSNLSMLTTERASLDLKEARLKVSIARDKIAMERMKASLELAEKNLSRYQELLKVAAVTQTELEIRKLECDNAGRDVSVKVLEAQQLDMELREIAVSRESLAARERQAQLAVEQAQQALTKAVTNLSYASIVSPIDGVVMERAVDPGQTIAAQFQTPNLFKIVSELRLLHVLAQIDEAEVSKIRPGQKVTFEVDAFRNDKFEGKVKAVRLKHENRSNLVTYPVVIEAENPPAEGFPRGKLRPGMTAFLTFEVQRKTGVAKVPAAALRFVPPEDAPVTSAMVGNPPAEKKAEKNAIEGMSTTVYVQGEAGGLKSIGIQVGDNDGEFYELLSGNLKAGDEVVTAVQPGIMMGMGAEAAAPEKSK